MSNVERTLRQGLPRPSSDPSFERRLLGKLLNDRVIVMPSPPDAHDRRALYVVVSSLGAAALGAAAIVVSAAIGFRKGRARRDMEAA